MAQAGMRDPAPEPLRLVQEFLNTNDIEGQRERLASASALRDWLADHDLLPAGEQLGEPDLAWAIELREALRALTAAHNHLPVDTATAVDVLNASTARAQLRPRLTADGTTSRLEAPVGGLAGALGQIVALVHGATADGTWIRMKACQRDRCRWAFYDHSKNQSGRGGHSAICGTKERSRRAYQRRRAGDR
jgi:predicted RNA-binding Zn ribbon-like protein